MTETRKGHIHRIVESLGMGYIAEPEKDRLWAFRFSQLEGYGGQYPEEMGLIPDAKVTFMLEDGALSRLRLDISSKTLAHSASN